MKLIKNIILFFLILLIYLHIYIHFKISDYNEFIELKEEINKQKILSSIYYKLPFVFDGTDIIKPFVKDKKEKKEKNKKKEKMYVKSYYSLPLLEPSVRFFTTDTVYELKKGKTDSHRNLHCRNFYMVHSGKVTIYCIHPKFKNLDISNIETETDVLRVELHPNSILFVPNYWMIHIKSHEKSLVERVQYKTILNEVNFFYDKIKLPKYWPTKYS